jgi:hypothetical protein
MKRYWQFAVVGIICLLVALLWAQPPRSHAQTTAVPVTQRTAATSPGSDSNSTPESAANSRQDDDSALPGSNSSLPLLAVIGFGVLAGGITSAMRTR